MLPQWHVKDPGHFAKSEGGRLHLNTHTPLTHRGRSGDYAAVQAECGNLSGNELTRNASGNTRLQSSQLAEPLWTDLGAKSGISVREIILTSKKQKNKRGGGGRRRGMTGQTFSQQSSLTGKSHRHRHHQ